MFKILDEMFDEDYINNGYYSWLMSPKGSPMQLDRYYPNLKLAFEHHGSQHFNHNKYYHKSKAKFDYLQECDRLKHRLCQARGVKLITMTYQDTLDQACIQQRIKESE